MTNFVAYGIINVSSYNSVSEQSGVVLSMPKCKQARLCSSVEAIGGIHFLALCSF
jgi:hypothetical protein